MTRLVSAIIFLLLAQASRAKLGDGGSKRKLQSEVCDGVTLWTTAEVAGFPIDASNCLLILYDKVFNLASYASVHIGGALAITKHCGQDATGGFSKESSIIVHNEAQLGLVAGLQVGVMKDSNLDPCKGRTSAPIPTPAPTPIPTPEPTPAPTPEFIPETFSCIACPPPAHYPRGAHLAAVGGSVQLRVDVSPEGWVMSATIAASSGSAELDQEAIVTVQNWQFTATAAGRYGVPVYVDFQLE